MSSLLEVDDLCVSFDTRYGEVEALNEVSLEVRPGETVAVVGESGSGKSVTALSVMGLLDNGSITSGSIRYQGKELTRLRQRELRRMRGNEIAMIFQNPMTSLDPLFTVGNQLAEALNAHTSMTRKQTKDRVIELLREVGMPDPEQRVRSYPHQLSGGQQQRVMIAIGLACSPALLIADEPTTALDVTVEAQILTLMKRLQQEHGTAMMFITHDMGVVAEVADRVVVMYAGKVVEQGTVEQVLTDPKNPYTRGLIASIPSPTIARDAQMPTMRGSVPGLRETPQGCRFHPRCPVAVERCAQEAPPLLQIGAQQTRCWFPDPENPMVVDETGPSSEEASHVR